MPEILADVGHCVDAVLRRVGPRVVLALPLGIGKPNPLANEFYRRALRDPRIDLTIITALSLLKPMAHSRARAPSARAAGGARVRQLRRAGVRARAACGHACRRTCTSSSSSSRPGAFLDSTHAQRHYLSANYTHVARAVLARGVNVIAHLVARRTLERAAAAEPRLQSRRDRGPAAADRRARARAGRDIVLVGETHAQMPFMTGHAQIEPERFDFLIDDPRYDYDLFAPPNAALGSVEHAIGLYASAWCATAARCRSGSASSAMR